MASVTRAKRAAPTRPATTATNGGAITTTAGQTYTVAVVLGADTTLTGVDVAFASTVKSDGTNRALTVTDSGTTSFTGAVGSAEAGEKLSCLTVNDGGTTANNGGACDDGALVPGDGCGPTCALEPCPPHRVRVTDGSHGHFV